jgi:hypothetical protein
MPAELPSLRPNTMAILANSRAGADLSRRLVEALARFRAG